MLDAEHRAACQGPISAETFRRHLKIGAHRARALVGQVRIEHTTLMCSEVLRTQRLKE